MDENGATAAAPLGSAHFANTGMDSHSTTKRYKSDKENGLPPGVDVHQGARRSDYG